LQNCTITGTQALRHSTSAERDLLLHYVDTAAVARSAASIQSTKTKQFGAFKHWSSFLISMRVKQLYLDNFTKYQQNIIMSAFAQAM
jgi:hypothetical protein